MDAMTVQVSPSTHEVLNDLARESNTTVAAVLDQAVQELRRKRFWAAFNAACHAHERLMGLQDEDLSWEATLADGLGEITRAADDVPAGQPESR